VGFFIGNKNMQRNELVKYLNQLFQADKFKDYCPNGLQIEGTAEINKIVCGVSLSQELIDYAISQNADAIIVHHGIFWNKDAYQITGIKYQRIAKLIKHDINLIAYHLPLDCHIELGNNAQLAKTLDIQVNGQAFDTQYQLDLIWHGELAHHVTAQDFAKHYHKQTGHTPLVLGNPNKLIKKIAWCTGGADSLFAQAIELGVDCFISGEVSEPVKAIAEENDVVYIAGGHYVTERYGIKTLAQHLTEMGLDSTFIELYNPV
jgi:dinuclear metal center YbgI/SA1388 family protein